MNRPRQCPTETAARLAYLKRFLGPSMRQARTQATNQTTAIEAVAFGR